LANAGAAGAVETLTMEASPSGSSLTLPMTVLRPDGAGPFPAIAMMHDCSGLGPRSSGNPKRWAAFLVAQGYVVAMPDSFTPRGLPDGVCIAGARGDRANYAVRAADAYGALAMLRTLAFVDPKRVAVMGGSHGGATTLASVVAASDEDDPLARAKADGFAAAVALYPRCDAAYGGWGVVRQNRTYGPPVVYSGVYKPVAPLLILAGELDDWTPAEACRRLVDASRKAGNAIDLVVYPGAHHSFDSDRPVRFVAERNNPASMSGRGATTGGNAEAWADAKARVTAFFARHLKNQM
jgi:dienelactone hydrolase